MEKMEFAQWLLDAFICECMEEEVDMNRIAFARIIELDAGDYGVEITMDDGADVSLTLCVEAHHR